MPHFRLVDPPPRRKKERKNFSGPRPKTGRCLNSEETRDRSRGAYLTKQGGFGLGGFFFLCAYPKDGDKRAHMFHGFNFKHTHTHTRTVAVHMGKKATSSIKLIFVY